MANQALNLEKKIENKTARVAVIGLGYVGLPLAIEFARAGFPVTGIDVDTRKIAALDRGVSYIPDVASADVKRFVAERRFTPASDYDLLKQVDVIFICVPTPFDRMKAPDLQPVISATQSIAPRLQPGQLVILQSTTYPGTTEEVCQPILEAIGLKAGVDFHLLNINESMPFHVVKLVNDALGRVCKPLNGARVLVLGVAFKRDVDDARKSPAERVIELLLHSGAHVRYHDPYVPVFRVGDDVFHRERVELRSVPLTPEELQNSDAVAIVTPHRAVDYDLVIAYAPLVVDSANVTARIERNGHVIRLGAPIATKVLAQ